MVSFKIKYLIQNDAAQDDQEYREQFHRTPLRLHLKKIPSLSERYLSERIWPLSKEADPAIRAVKSAKFQYAAPPELFLLFREFQSMCNDAIRIAFRSKPKTRFALQELAYSRLKEYGLHTHYILSACEVAFSIYRNKNRKSVPSVKKAFLKLDNQSYQLNHLLLRLPVTSRHFIFLTLRGSNYHLSFVDNPALKKGSVTITEKAVIIVFSKIVEFFKPVGYIGIDINEKNVTVSATGGWTNHFQELGEVVEIKETYREIRAKINRQTRQDNRVCERLLAKYGRRERNRTIQRIHKITKRIVDYARDHVIGIKMEGLTGIRRYYKKGNGQSNSYRGRMNTWVFGETQRQVDYKSKWEGVPDWHVDPRGSSSYCLCGSRVVRLRDRKVFCPTCDWTWDRDDLASRNIMACVVPQVLPSKGSGEGERGDGDSNPPNR